MYPSAAIFACACLLVLAAGSCGGVPPETGGPETPPAVTEAPPPPPAPPLTKAFEYIERIEVTSGGTKLLEVASNALVLVTPGPGTVTVELRPGIRKNRTPGALAPDSTSGAPMRRGDPPPDKVSVVAGGESSGAQWDLPALRVVFTFSPWEKGNVRMTGLGDRALTEACMLLGQGPVSHKLASQASAEYSINIESGSRPFAIKCEQRTGELWVDWLLRGRGVLKVGSRGWQMPMRFILLPQEVPPRKDVAIAAEASLRYSSTRPGPEDETKLVTTLTFTGKGEQLVYRRECELRPFTAPDKMPELEKVAVPPAGDLGGKAAHWARMATLATLGVQRLAGVRETGVGMWVAQVGIDSLAGREVPRVASRESRKGISSVDKLSPRLRPLPGLAEAQIGWKNLIRAEVGMSAVKFTAEMAGIEDTGTGISPDLSISVRRKFGERWRLGAGVDVISIYTNTNDPDGNWSALAILARAERVSGNTSLGVSAGYAFVGYEMDSKSAGSAKADLTAPAVAVDWEWSSRRSFGFGVKGQYSGDGELVILRVQPGVRWQFGRNVALQAQAVWIKVSDAEAFGGEVAASGLGAGAGVAVRW